MFDRIENKNWWNQRNIFNQIMALRQFNNLLSIVDSVDRVIYCSPLPYYYTDFAFISCIKSPNIDNTLIKIFQQK